MARVIIYRLGSLGDTIATLPCFHLVERSFPEDERILLTNVPVASNAPPVESILRPGGFVHGSIPYPLGLRNPYELARLGGYLRRQDIRALVYLTERFGFLDVRRDAAFFKLCGIPEIIGVPYAADLRHYRRLEDGQLEPESQRLGRMLASLGKIDFEDRSWWDLRLTEQERTAAAISLMSIGATRFVAVNTGGKVPEKHWGSKRWEILLRLLTLRLRGWALVVLGSREDAEVAHQLRAVWDGPTKDLCGVLSPRESAAALERAALFIGHDSGPFHLADAVGTPAIGLYGNYNRPRVWHPTGPNTRVIHRMSGLSNILPEEVEEQALTLLQRCDRPAAMSD